MKGDNNNATPDCSSQAKIMSLLLECGIDGLFKAIEENDFKKVKELVNDKNSKIDFSGKLDNGNNLFHIAATKNSNILYYLLERISEKMNYDKNYEDLINGKNNWGYTPLHCAVRTKDFLKIGFLIQFGADTTAANVFEMNSIELAEGHGDENVAEFIKYVKEFESSIANAYDSESTECAPTPLFTSQPLLELSDSETDNKAEEIGESYSQNRMRLSSSSN